MKKALLLSLAMVFVLTGCGKKTEEKPVIEENTPTPIVVPVSTPNPSVDKYKDVATCDGREDFQDCYANQAVSKNDPTLCQKLEPGLDMLCYQYFYIQKNDSKSCNLLPNKTIRAVCVDYYRNLDKK